MQDFIAAFPEQWREIVGVLLSPIARRLVLGATKGKRKRSQQQASTAQANVPAEGQ